MKFKKSVLVMSLALTVISPTLSYANENSLPQGYASIITLTENTDNVNNEISSDFPLSVDEAKEVQLIFKRNNDTDITNYTIQLAIFEKNHKQYLTDMLVIHKTKLTCLDDSASLVKAGCMVTRDFYAFKQNTRAFNVNNYKNNIYSDTLTYDINYPDLPPSVTINYQFRDLIR